MSEKKIAWEKWHGMQQDLSIQQNLYSEEDNEVLNLIREEVEAFESLSSDFWILNTNFDINNSVLKKILKIEGVERFQPITRYKAVVGFPKSGFFKPRNIMANIQEALCSPANIVNKEDSISEVLDPSLLNRINSTQKDISKYKYWKMLVLPNGFIEAICTNKMCKKYKVEDEIIENCFRLIGGLIRSSEDEKYVF